MTIQERDGRLVSTPPVLGRGWWRGRANQDIHAHVAFLLDHAPPHVHPVLAGRLDPPLPLARWRARGELVELRAADLRFTSDEALTGRSWRAVLIVAGGFGLQHIALPLLPSGTFMLWRLPPSLLLGLINAALYLRVRRLLPFILAHWPRMSSPC